jgi:hypothetical protein
VAAATPVAGALDTEFKSSMKWLQEQESKALKKVDGSAGDNNGQGAGPKGGDGGLGDGPGGDFGGALVSLAALRGSLGAGGGAMFSPARGGRVRPRVPQASGAASLPNGFRSPVGGGSTAYTRALGQAAPAVGLPTGGAYGSSGTTTTTTSTAAALAAVPQAAPRKMLTIKPRAPRPPSDAPLAALAAPPSAPSAAPGRAAAPLTPPPAPDADGDAMPALGGEESAGGGPAVAQAAKRPPAVPAGAAPPSARPTLTKAHYVCLPSIAELRALPLPALRAVSGLVVEKYDPKTSERVGSVAWLDPVNLEGANLDEDVTIVNCHADPKGYFSVAVYEHYDGQAAPKAGSRLNQRAEITFWGVHCKSSQPEKVAAYPAKMRDMVSSIGGTFVSYKDGVLKYRVANFDAE